MRAPCSLHGLTRTQTQLDATAAAPRCRLHTLWLSVPVGAAVGAWWFIFLVAYPAQFAAYVEEAERRGIDWRQNQDYL